MTSRRARPRPSESPLRPSARFGAPLTGAAPSLRLRCGSPRRVSATAVATVAPLAPRPSWLRSRPGADHPLAGAEWWGWRPGTAAGPPCVPKPWASGGSQPGGRGQTPFPDVASKGFPSLPWRQASCVTVLETGLFGPGATRAGNNGKFQAARPQRLRQGGSRCPATSLPGRLGPRGGY